MKNKIIFETALINYFKDAKKSVLFTDLVISRLGEVLGDDAIYGSISKGSSYLVQKINQKYLKNNPMFDLENLPGEEIVEKLDELIETETDLHLEQNYKNRLLNITFSNEDTKFVNQVIKDCNHHLKDETQVCIDGKKYDVEKLSASQKISLMVENSVKLASEYYERSINLYDEINEIINQKLNNRFVKKIQPK